MNGENTRAILLDTINDLALRILFRPGGEHTAEFAAQIMRLVRDLKDLDAGKSSAPRP